MYRQWYGYEPFDPRETGSRAFAPSEPAILDLAMRNYPGEPRRQALEALRLLQHFNTQWMHHLEQADVDALIAASRLWEFHASLLCGATPPAAAVNRWSLRGMGHDSVNQFVCVEAKCQRQGHDPTCPACGGEGSIWKSAEAKSRYEAWQEFEPPAGDGWQMWESTSEGSPISPVCATAEALAQWLADHGASAFGRMTASYEEWLAMIGVGSSVASMVQGPTGALSGVAAVSDPSFRAE
jgi:hypothetical protein